MPCDLSDILFVDPSLSVDTRIYRTVDFFTVASIIDKQFFGLTRADIFEDRNEAIDRLLMQLSSSYPYSCGSMGWKDDLTAKAFHEAAQKSHYVSCWSRTPESVAMWALYSPDYLSVRISTSIEKLKLIALGMLDKYSIFRLDHKERALSVVSVNAHISPVKYVHLNNLLKRISTRAKAGKRLRERLDLRGESPKMLTPEQSTKSHESYKRKFPEFVDWGREYCLLKDISFNHEDEIRLSVRLGEEMYNLSDDCQRGRDLKLKWNPKMINFMLDCFLFITKSGIPVRETVNCPTDFIESVALDPRCPDYKMKFMEDWFLSRNVPIVQSDCFGYLPKAFDVFPNR